MRRAQKRELATYAWLGLCGYILATDIALIASGRKSMTEVWEEALRHPYKKWILFAAWGFTTKHLFTREILPKIDPFQAIGGGAALVQKFLIKPSGVPHGYGQYGLLESIDLNDSAIGSGLRDQAGDILGS